MANKDLTVAELISAAGAQLLADFEHRRSTAFHAGEQGAEIEDVLRTFLNAHLPKRFAATSAHLVDSENTHSKQTDVAIYDTLTSPVFRSSKTSLILPVDHVAAVVEVKTSLDKHELEDAYAKIASCKSLKKTQQSPMDRAATGSDLSKITTMGVVFAFDSNTSLDTLAENARDLNKAYDSNLWPDLVVVLDKGVITYAVQFPGENPPIGLSMGPTDERFIIPPGYELLSVINDGHATLNRFFTLLLSQLTFFPHRPSSIPFAQALAGAKSQLKIIQGYQYDLSRRRRAVGDERQLPTAELALYVEDKLAGQLSYFPWQDGAIVACGSTLPLEPILGMFLELREPAVLIKSGPLKYSSVLKLTEAEFRTWPDKLAALGKNTNLSLKPFSSADGKPTS